MVLPFGSGHAPTRPPVGQRTQRRTPPARHAAPARRRHCDTLDGSRISTWTELARELEAAYGPMRFPSEPRAKCLSILNTALGKPPRPKVLLWRHASHTARTNPALLVEVTSRWTNQLTSAWSPSCCSWTCREPKNRRSSVRRNQSSAPRAAVTKNLPGRTRLSAVGLMVEAKAWRDDAAHRSRSCPIGMAIAAPIDWLRSP